MITQEVLYYPYAGINDVNMVKRALLYFDKIYLLDPWKATTDDLTRQAVTEWEHVFQELSGKDIIKLIHPHEYIKNDHKVITDNVIYDMESEEFWRICAPYVDKSWFLAESKIPEDFESDTRVRQLLVGLPNYVQSSPHVMPQMLHKMIKGNCYEEMASLSEAVREVAPAFGEARQKVYRSYHEVVDEREREDEQSVEYRLLRLPFPIGESLILNHTLRITHHYPQLIPFTDDPIHDQFLRWKHGQLAQQRSTRSLLRESDLIQDIKQDLTAMQVMKLELPDMKNVPIAEILKLRDHRQRELEAFRVRVGKLSADIEIEYWDDKFATEVRRRVDQELRQELNTLKASFESLKGDKWKWLTGAGTGVMGLGSVPLVFSILPGMPVACIVAAAAGIYALDKYLDSRKAQTKLRRNGVAFLFHANALATRLPS